MTTTPTSRQLSKERLAGWVPQFTDASKHPSTFNALTATVQSLRKTLESGDLKTTLIVEEDQRSVCKYNEWLGAIYQLAPGAIEGARELDVMRGAGKLLGPFHGIPVLVKDNIGTPKAMQMSTTEGAVALIGSEPESAPIVDDVGSWECEEPLYMAESEYSCCDRGRLFSARRRFRSVSVLMSFIVR